MNTTSGICSQFILDQNPLEILKFRNSVLFDESSTSQVYPSLFGKLPDCLILIRKRVEIEEEGILSSLLSFFTSSKPNNSETKDIILKQPKIAEDGEELFEKTYNSFFPLEEQITSQYNHVFGVDTSIVMSIVTYIHGFIQKLEEKEKDDYLSLEEEGGLLVQIDGGSKGYKPVVFEEQGKIIGALFCCFNPITGLDMRVEVQIPGTVRCYFVSDKEGRCMSLEQMRQRISNSETQQNLSKINLNVKIEEKIQKPQLAVVTDSNLDSKKALDVKPIQQTSEPEAVSDKAVPPSEETKPANIEEKSQIPKNPSEIETLSHNIQDLSENPQTLAETQTKPPSAPATTSVINVSIKAEPDVAQLHKKSKNLVSEEELFDGFYFSSFLRYSQFPIWSKSLSLYGVHVLDINEHQYWKKHSTWKYFFEKKILNVARRCFQDPHANHSSFRLLWELNEKPEQQTITHNGQSLNPFAEINTKQCHSQVEPSILGDLFSQYFLRNGFWNQALSFFSLPLTPEQEQEETKRDFGNSCTSTFYLAKTLMHMLRYQEADQILTKKITEITGTASTKDVAQSIGHEKSEQETNAILDLILLEIECLLAKEKDKSIKSQVSVAEKLNSMQKNFPIAEYLTTLSSAAMSLCSSSNSSRRKNQTQTYLLVAKVFLFLGQFENCLWILNQIPISDESSTLHTQSPKTKLTSLVDSDFSAFYLYDDLLLESISSVSFHNYDIGKKMTLTASDDRLFEKKYFNLSPVAKISVPKWLFFETISNTAQVFSSLTGPNIKEIQERMEFENRVQRSMEVLQLPGNQLKGIVKEIYDVVVDLYHNAGWKQLADMKERLFSSGTEPQKIPMNGTLNERVPNSIENSIHLGGLSKDKKESLSPLLEEMFSCLQKDLIGFTKWKQEDEGKKTLANKPGAQNNKKEIDDEVEEENEGEDEEEDVKSQVYTSTDCYFLGCLALRLHLPNFAMYAFKKSCSRGFNVKTHLKLLELHCEELKKLAFSLPNSSNLSSIDVSKIINSRFHDPKFVRMSTPLLKQCLLTIDRLFSFFLDVGDKSDTMTNNSYFQQQRDKILTNGPKNSNSNWHIHPILYERLNSLIAYCGTQRVRENVIELTLFNKRIFMEKILDSAKQNIFGFEN